MQLICSAGGTSALPLVAIVLGLALALSSCSSSESRSRLESSTKHESEGVVLISPNEQGEYWKTGKLKARWEIDYRDGEVVRHGETAHWHWNGSLFAVGEYADGKEFGTWTHWSTNGTKVYEQVLDEGEPVFRTLFFGDGSKKAEGPLFDGERHGKWKEWDKDDEAREVMYKRGERVK